MENAGAAVSDPRTACAVSHSRFARDPENRHPRHFLCSVRFDLTTRIARMMSSATFRLTIYPRESDRRQCS